MDSIYYLEMFLLILVFVLIGGYLVYSVFKWGYNKEKRNERTDLWGRSNNHMSKDDMD